MIPSLVHREFTKYHPRMKTRARLRVLLATVMALALLPMLSTLSPGVDAHPKLGHFRSGGF